MTICTVGSTEMASLQIRKLRKEGTKLSIAEGGLEPRPYYSIELAPFTNIF